MEKTSLFDEFPGVSPKGWKQKIQVDLKGADYNEKLIWTSPEGIQVKPFYSKEDVQNPVTGINPETQWTIGQLFNATDAAAANQKARQAISKGAEGITFVVPTDKVEVGLLLEGIDLKRVEVQFDFQFFSGRYFEHLLKKTAASSKNIYLNLDPIGHLARTGNWHKGMKEDLSEFCTLVSQYPEANCIAVDMSLYQNAGANITQQLAYGMAQANEYLNLFNAQQEAAVITPTFNFKIAIGGNYFFEIAKLRALRVLWRSLITAYERSGECFIAAVPSNRNKTLYDYNNNMIRTTMEQMAAGLGGANLINGLPYDVIYQFENEFGDRIARNQLIILKHESHLDKVNNPADGTYYIEKLTQQLSEKALVLFKDIEKGGGFLKQLKAHSIQKKVKESAARELALFNAGQEVLVGANAYQTDLDLAKENLEKNPFVISNPRKTLIEPIIEKRLAAEQEQQRMKNE